MNCDFDTLERDISRINEDSFADRMAQEEGRWYPVRPRNREELRLESNLLGELVIKLANTVNELTTDWASRQLCVSVQMVEDVFWNLKKHQLVEVLGQVGPFNYRYSLTSRGREQAERLLQICGYVGPTPVSIEDYAAMLDWDDQRRTRTALEDVKQALAALTLEKEVVQVASLAAVSGRSLFLFGPSGNGKTTMGRLIHRVQKGSLWIPHALAVGSSIIQLYDPQCHTLVEKEAPVNLDRRWRNIERPFVVAGGEMTPEDLDLSYSPTVRSYEAPPHVKANGGTFLIDDFGRQRVKPEQLLNRWIIPLEHRVDYVTLMTGQKLALPFRQMLIVATNLNVSDVADPAFLRRMGYRVCLKSPTENGYRLIFKNYVQACNLELEESVLDRIVARYAEESRELRGSEPGELIERARDICKLLEQPFELTPEVLDLAWIAFFGNTDGSQIDRADNMMS